MKEQLISLINSGEWDTAGRLLEANVDTAGFDDTIAVLAATIYEHFSEGKRCIDFIERGLSFNPCNYELYMLLGNYYAASNVNLSYLCYENAEFFCKKQVGTESEDFKYISELKNSLKDNPGLEVHPASIIILSYNTLEYTKLCLKSIRTNCYDEAYEIVVIDNASTDGSREWLENQSDIIFVANESNAGFPAGCNQGIELAASDNDIFLLNSDTIMTPNALFTLRMGLYDSGRNGASGSVTNYAANNQMIKEVFDKPSDYQLYAAANNIPVRSRYEYKSWLVGFALLIKRKVLNEVGLLDTIYSPGNYEDNDICTRIRNAGYNNILCHNSFIYYWGSKSFEHDGAEKYIERLRSNSNKFRDKWNFDPDYYSNIRMDLISYIGQDKDEPVCVLEIGCGSGATLAHIKYLYPNSTVHGIELVDTVAELAYDFLNVITGNVEAMDLPYPKDYFDYIICGDVLEHLRDPEAVIARLRPHLKEGGCILTSIPNIMNAEVIYNLLHGDFSYTDSGILDRTHLKFFTGKEIVKMFKRLGFEIIEMKYNVMERHTTDDYKEFFDKLLQIDGVADRMEFDAYQYLVKARKRLE